MSRLANDLTAMWRELVGSRELLASLVRRDLILRYKETVMGVGWALFVPLLNMLVFSVIFMRVVPLDTGVPYPVYAYAGLLPWHLFASAVRFGTNSLTANTNLVTKVYFPREVLPLSAVIVAVVDFAVASIVLAGLMWYYGVAVSGAIVWLPLVIAVLVAFAAGMALLLAMSNLFFRDFRYVVDVGLWVWMLATSVVYPVERVGGGLGAVFRLNPMTPIIDAFRGVLLLGEPPDARFGVAAAVALVVFLGAWLWFHRLEYRFAEEI